MSTPAIPAKTYGILFGDPMARALKADRKDVTRRPINFERSKGGDHAKIKKAMETPDLVFSVQPTGEPRLWEVVLAERASDRSHVATIRCPYGQPGDTLFAKESWSTRYCDRTDGDQVTGDVPFYRADYEDDPAEVKWKPSILMPERYSRFRLHVLTVSAERVQQISENDARREGFQSFPTREYPCVGYGLPEWPEADLEASYGDAFRKVWRDLHGPEGWKRNPWVWRVGFRLEKLENGN